MVQGWGSQQISRCSVNFPFLGVGLTLDQMPQGVKKIKFTIYAFLVPKMHHMKFEKNWSSGYQEVKNVQMLTDTIHNVWPGTGGKTSTPRIKKFTILVDAFLLYITMHLVFLKYIQFKRRFFKSWSIVTFCAPPQRLKGGQET